MTRLLRSVTLAVAAVFIAVAVQGCTAAAVGAAGAAGAAGGYEAHKHGYGVQSPVKKDRAGGYKAQSPVTKRTEDNQAEQQPRSDSSR